MNNSSAENVDSNWKDLASVCPIAKEQWARPDSNRRPPPCEGEERHGLKRRFRTYLDWFLTARQPRETQVLRRAPFGRYASQPNNP